ncbi:hypothetical protein RRF57_013032 [Xylaria bambusicola]|uniref:Uncharacterized protein n=1 Tax=Xylaria bambusicola TaxID=326684 RepID=A0AAN7UQX2_9PEZI
MRVLRANNAAEVFKTPSMGVAYDSQAPDDSCCVKMNSKHSGKSQSVVSPLLFGFFTMDIQAVSYTDADMELGLGHDCSGKLERSVQAWCCIESSSISSVAKDILESSRVVLALSQDMQFT